MIGVFYGRNLTEMRSCHEKENRNAIVEIKRELNQFTIYYSVIVTLNDKKLAQITKLFLLNYKFAGKSAGNSLAGQLMTSSLSAPQSRMKVIVAKLVNHFRRVGRAGIAIRIHQRNMVVLEADSFFRVIHDPAREEW